MNLMYAQMGLSVVQSFASTAVARQQEKMAQAVQDYNNTMSALAAAQSNNTTTLNEISVQDASVRDDIAIQQEAMIAVGDAEVAAGAAGVGGGAIDSVMFGLRSSAAKAQYGRQQSLKNQFMQFGQERTNTELAKVTNKDVTILPRTSAGTALLGAGTSLLKIWDSHQTPDQKLAARLGS